MFSFVQEPAVKAERETVDTEIRKLENKYKIKFPEVLRKYYLGFDGARIKLQRLEIRGYSCEVSGIVPICGDGLSFEKIVENDRTDGFISEDFYPLATDRGGDIYYWDAKSEHVYLMLADDIENPFLASNSVADFFELLH